MYDATILVVLEIWSQMLDDGDLLDAIYLDFQKAFDSVPHQRLLSKLNTYGMHGQITLSGSGLYSRKEAEGES